jgi:hypothetical protein
MGLRTQRILPVIVTLNGDGIKIIEGKARSPVPAIPGLGSKEVTWMIRAPKSARIEVKAETQCAWRDSLTIDLGGTK